jgi:hypothetical protein
MKILFNVDINNIFFNIYIESTPAYKGPSWDFIIVAIVPRWSLYRSCSSKISINFGQMDLRPVVVDRWPLFRVGY